MGTFRLCLPLVFSIRLDVPFRRMAAYQTRTSESVAMRSCDLRYQNPNDPAIATYIVPCVVKAVCMVEILRKSQTGLRVEDLRSMTGYSKSTIYRILRSLTWCEYLFRDAGGFYRLNHDVITIAQENTYSGA